METPASKPIRSRSKSAVTSPAISPEEKQRMIAEAAYYHAEQRGFVPGEEMQDWLLAEAEIEQLLASNGAQRRRPRRTRSTTAS